MDTQWQNLLLSTYTKAVENRNWLQAAIPIESKNLQKTDTQKPNYNLVAYYILAKKKEVAKKKAIDKINTQRKHKMATLNL